MGLLLAELISLRSKKKEFLNNFARLKFLPHGYCSNSNTPLEYNQATCLFESPKGMEKHLKLSKSSIGTPMQVFKRLLRSMLCMDDPKTLATIMTPQVLSIFEEDYVIVYFFPIEKYLHASQPH